MMDARRWVQGTRKRTAQTFDCPIRLTFRLGIVRAHPSIVPQLAGPGLKGCVFRWRYYCAARCEQWWRWWTLSLWSFVCVNVENRKSTSCLIYQMKEFFSTVAKKIYETKLWNWFLGCSRLSMVCLVVVVVCLTQKKELLLLRRIAWWIPIKVVMFSVGLGRKTQWCQNSVRKLQLV